MQKRSNLYIFGFAGVVTVFASIVLSLAATALKPMQQLNVRLDVVRNILSVAGYDASKIHDMKPDQVLEIYRKEFQVLLLDKNNEPASREDLESALSALGYKGEDLAGFETFEVLQIFQSKLPLLARKDGKKLEEFDPGYKMVYLYKPTGSIEAYIIPISGNGLWDMIYGYLALNTDLNTVKGIRFYSHGETPGLGGEIEKPWFTGQFEGKQILDADGSLVSVRIEKGKAAIKHPGEDIIHYVDGISGATITGKAVTKFLHSDLEKYEPYFQKIRGSASSTKEEPAQGVEGMINETLKQGGGML